jgi:gamma-glutamylcyclotransferase (GGCT)/AIG2-like uncharacterized protein YtfP
MSKKLSKGKSLVFIYGNHRKGFKGHDLLAGAEYLGERITTRMDFGLSVIHGIPAAFTRDRGAGCRLRGELYKVSQATLEKLDTKSIIKDVSTRVRVKLFGCGKKAITYVLLQKPDPHGPNVTVLDDPPDKVYDWKSHTSNTKPKMEEKPMTNSTNTPAKEPVVQKTYDPMVEYPDGTKVNRNSLAYEALDIADTLEYYMKEDGLDAKERGTYVWESIKAIRALGVQMSGVL